jgi:hypothetical protein
MHYKHRYILASNKVPKLNCPHCGAKKHWQRYLDTATGEVLPEQYGCCDNSAKCGHHVLPPFETVCYFALIEGIKEISERAYLIIQHGKSIVIPKKTVFEQLPAGVYMAEYFLADNKYKIEYQSTDMKCFSSNGDNVILSNKNSKPCERKEPVFIPVDVFKQTLQPDRYEQNIFIQNLLSRVAFPYDTKEIEKVISLYYLGTVANGYRAGAITFPFIDLKGNVRAIQVKQFDETNHTTITDFLHSIIEKHHSRNNKPLPEWLEAYTKQEKIVSCLFGEHLLSKYPFNPVALVEAPKTAVYGTLYFGLPEKKDTLIWLAVYNKGSFSLDKLKVLQGRDVFTFPDLSKDGSTFNEWKTKANEIQNQLPGTRFIFSDLLEQYAPETDKIKGNDLADYLINLDWRKFRKHLPTQETIIVKTDICEKREKCESPGKSFFSPVDEEQIEALPEPKTLDDIFKYFYKKGCKSLPKGIQINADKWKGNII